MDASVFTAIISVAATCVEILGVLAAIHAIMHARTAQGAVAWFFALIAFPLITLPPYWIFGRRRFQGYFVSRRKGETETHQAVRDKLNEYKRDFEAQLTEAERRFLPCEKLAGLPFLSGNNVKLLIDGEQTFDAILRKVER